LTRLHPSRNSPLFDFYSLRRSSGSLAIFAAIRRASSRDSSFAADCRLGLMQDVEPYRSGRGALEPTRRQWKRDLCAGWDVLNADAAPANVEAAAETAAERAAFAIPIDMHLK
jgi:hypothetical protein